MLANVDYLKRSLEQVREVVHASMQPDRRDGPKSGHDVPMYAEPMKPQYPVGGEVKKRRGVSFPRCSLTMKVANRNLARRPSWQMPQLQPNRHTRMATWP